MVGEPFFPPVHDVREWAFTQVQLQMLRLLLPWNEAREMVFFDDEEHGLKEAFRLLEGLNPDAALCAALDSLERARTRPRRLGRALYNAAVCLQVRGDADAAMPLFQEALEGDPANAVFREAAEECRREVASRRG